MSKRYFPGPEVSQDDIKRRKNSTIGKLQRFNASDIFESMEYFDTKQPTILLQNGDFLVLFPNHIQIVRSIFQRLQGSSYFRMKSPLVSIVKHALPTAIKFVDMITNSKYSQSEHQKEIVLAGTNGTILFIPLPDDEDQPLPPASRVHHIAFSHEDEEIVHMTTIDSTILILSNKNEFYVINRSMPQHLLITEKLQRPTNVLYGLFTTSVKLFGLNALLPTTSTQLYEKLIPVPEYSLLLGIGEQLILWGNYLSIGQEKLLYELSLQKFLLDDFQEYISNSSTSTGSTTFVGTPFIRFLDACIVNYDIHRNQMIILILSGISTTKQHYDEHTGKLWLHCLELSTEDSSLSLTSTASTAASAPATTSITPRLSFRIELSSKDVQLWAPHPLTSIPSSAQGYKPSIHHIFPSGRVYISWNEYNQPHTLQTTQFDLIHLQHRIQDTSFSFFSSSKFMNTNITMSSIACLNSIAGIDGLGIVLPSSRELVIVDPPISLDQDTDELELSDGLQMTLEFNQMIEYLLSYLYKKQSTTTTTTTTSMAIEEVIDNLSKFSLIELERIFQLTSERIVHKSALGRYWGQSLPSSEDHTSMIPMDTMMNLNELQLAHRLIQDKLDQHSQLIVFMLQMSKTHEIPSMNSVLEHHQMLLLSSGFAYSIHDSQLRYERKVHNIQEYQPVLAFIMKAIEQIVYQERRVSKEDLLSKGLSVLDQFYSESHLIIDGLVDIITMILSNKHFSSNSLYVVIVLMMKTLDYVSEGMHKLGLTHYGGLTNDKLRQSMIQLFIGYSEYSSIINKRTSMTPTTSGLRSEQAHEEEIKHVFVHTIDLLLDSFVQDLTNNSSVETMPLEWKHMYHTAKHYTLHILLHMKYYSIAFELSNKYDYFAGLLYAMDESPENNKLSTQFEQILMEKGDVMGTDDVCLAIFTFEYLESKQRYAEIFSLGKLSSHNLQDFLNTRPQLAWMYHLSLRQYDQVTTTCLQSTEIMKNSFEKSNIYLSIGKLSATLLQSKVQSTSDATSTLPEPSFLPQKSNKITPEVINKQLEAINNDLFLLNSQEIVQQILGTTSMNEEDKACLSSMELMNQILLFLTEQSKLTLELRVPSYDLIRLAGITLSLCEYTLKSMETKDPSKLIETNVTLLNILKQLYTVLIVCDEELWLYLCQYQALSLSELTQLRQESILYRLLAQGIEDMKSNGMRKDWLSIDLNFLQSMLLDVDVMKKQMLETGDIVVTETNNPRVMMIIQECIQLVYQDQQFVC